MTTMSPLRRRMIEDMTLRNLSRSTQQSYIYAVAKFSRYFQQPPDRLGMDEVRAYQLHLVNQKYSWTHINQVACALIRSFTSRTETVSPLTSTAVP
jgi:integrase/recombinase XerD